MAGRQWRSSAKKRVGDSPDLVHEGGGKGRLVAGEVGGRKGGILSRPTKSHAARMVRLEQPAATMRGGESNSAGRLQKSKKKRSARQIQEKGKEKNQEEDSRGQEVLRRSDLGTKLVKA